MAKEKIDLELDINNLTSNNEENMQENNLKEVEEVVKELSEVEKLKEKTEQTQATADLLNSINENLMQNSAVQTRLSEKEYQIAKTQAMVEQMKTDEVVEVAFPKFYAEYLGKVYTFLLNGLPIVVKFDGTKQKFPRFIYNYIQDKLSKIVDSNTSSIDTEQIG